MDKKKHKLLEEEGFQVGTYADFLELTPEDVALIEALPIPQLGADHIGGVLGNLIFEE